MKHNLRFELRTGFTAMLLVALLMSLVASPAQAMKYPDVSPIKVRGFKVSVQGDTFISSVAFSVKKHQRSAYYDQSSAKVMSTRMKADFGEFGKVDLRFHKRGGFKPKALPRHCHGTPEKVQRGAWKGKIHFQGEHRYLAFTRLSAAGKVTKSGNYSCPAAPTHTYVRLLATNPGHGSISAQRRRFGGKVRYAAADGSVVAGLYVAHTSVATGPASSFDYSPFYSQATVQPPGPLFSGTGRYDVSGGDSHLRGGLKVHLLGTGPFKLTGDDVNVMLSEVQTSARSDTPLRPGGGP
ncbi:hypothetical protein BH10ACT11_BH10ACT11_03840 [soil metagenome]